MSLRDQPGPYGAPYGDGLDPRWGEPFLYLMSVHPDERGIVWQLMSDVTDWARRCPDVPNPYWALPPEIPNDMTPADQGPASPDDSLIH